MRVPSYHKQTTWQRFFVGCFIGAIFSYVIFIYMYGSMYETLIEEKLHLESEVGELKDQNEALLQDKKDLDKEKSEKTTVDEIDITIENKDELEIDRLLIHELEGKIRETLKHIIGQEVSIVGASMHLLVSTLEKQKIEIDDYTYQFHITRLIISEKTKITLEASIVNIS
ncbi:MAG TPA: sporulation membrane protein YtrI [Bacillota bacterium]|nr:sporulation membrane protein YtrI [Bacillota bacterium]